MDKYKEKRAELVKEARKLVETAKAETRDLSADEKTKYDNLISEVDKLGQMIEAEERVARLETTLADVPMKKEERKVMGYDEIRSAMLEKRAITVNSTGKINVVSELAKAILKKTPMLSAVKLYMGRDANTNIPVWGNFGTTTANSESGTITADSTASLSLKQLTPKQYAKFLSCSWESLNLSGANLEAELPELFAKSFAVDIQDQIINGDGTGNNMTGLFLNTAITNDLTFTAAAAPKLSDIIGLALKVQDYAYDAGIVMSPSCFSALLGDTTSGSDVFKEEMARLRSIMGVKIILTSAAPYATSAGSVVAVGGDLSSYGLGIAGEMVIRPVASSTTTDTIYQAALWANGAPIVPANFWQLKAA